MKDSAILLLSGGLDSATVLAMQRPKYKNIITLSFDYEQRHRLELDLAKKLSKIYNCINILITLDPQLFLGTSLIARNKIDIPILNGPYTTASKIPSTYVPARNILFLSHALALAESHSCTEIFIGINAVDYSGYPDCRPEFLNAFNQMSRLGTSVGVEEDASKKNNSGGEDGFSKGNSISVLAPLLYLTKKEIIQIGLDSGLDYSYTNSCYQPQTTGVPCLKCDSCKIRSEGFVAVGVQDPILQKVKI